MPPTWRPRAYRDGDEWVINGNKTWNTGLHAATHDLIFARTSGEPGQPRGITAFIVPTDTPGFKVEEFLWTFNMPTDHATISLTNVRVHKSTIFGGLDDSLSVVQSFVNENRIRQAASSLGAAQYCIDEAVEYAHDRRPFGKALATNQAIQFPLVELQTQCEMLRALIHKTAWEIDTYGEFAQSDKVSMCNYWANRLCCEAADRAMQVHGGLGYSRKMPFEHIYRHHRRYRITEGSEEMQMRRVAGYMFGFMGSAPQGRVQAPAGEARRRRYERSSGSLRGQPARRIGEISAGSGLAPRRAPGAAGTRSGRWRAAQLIGGPAGERVVHREV